VKDRRDPKQIVSTGYDAIVERYGRWALSVREEERARYTALLLERLPPGSRVLELGCGAGLPTTLCLAESFAVTGIDLSARQVERARQNVPGAAFVRADMAAIGFAPASFDAVASFYALIHLPRREQPGLLRKVATWLRPGGLLVASMGAGSVEAEVAGDWLGAPMYWSSFDAATNRRLVEEAGLRLLRAREETADEFGQPVTFLWIVAEKPEEQAGAGEA
jgi:SAM-dependent methyltransferase